MDGSVARDGPDAVACEEPLEIQLEADSLAVVMRTPGHDLELAMGFLLTERVIERADQVVSLHAHSRARDGDGDDNVVRAVLGADVKIDADSLRRNLFASSSCGVCGKATIENALRCAPALDDPARFRADFFTRLPDALREAQAGFDHTGGLHAAALFSPEGERLVVREDVGRHNAVDKVVGFALREGHGSLAGHALMVSGRISYEIVQKALAARIPVVAAVSAPTSLAVGLAEASGITLVAFLRGRRFSVYGLRERVVG
ncbi:MAG: formate dehydrogenase accessory sulfurtransferase FdhD [Myxococcales bacterium]|nr:formate dehydrogenase accessory sulfurtransferase FdhD [Myxococcales bacterium]